jgi:hypothetical protein
MSQYCAIAVLIGLTLRVRAWKLLVLVAGLASAVSGTGVILLLIGLVLQLLRAPRVIRPTYAVAGALALALVLVSPVASYLLNRTGEVSQQQSSGYSRFIAPYEQANKGLEKEPERYLVGGGPGSVDRVLPSNRTGAGTVVLYGVIPKLTFEYGIVAGGLFLIFLVVGMVDGAPFRVLPGAFLVMTFFLSGGLLQPQTAYLAWVFTGLGSSERPVEPRSRWRREVLSR